MKKPKSKIFRGLMEFCFKSSEDYVTVHAAYSALFIFMALFPTILFILLLLAKINVSREYLISQLFNIIPANFHDFIRDIVDGLEETASGFTYSFSLLLAIWTSSAGVYGIVLGLNDVYRTYDTRPYVWRRAVSILYTFVIVIGVALSLGLVVFGDYLKELILYKWPEMSAPLDVLHWLKFPVVFIVLTLMFSLMYRFLPFMKSKWTHHLYGSLFAALGWLVMSYLFSLYINHFPSDAMYGSLTTIVLFLLWLWLALCILYLGAEINSILMDIWGVKPVNDYRRLTLDEIENTENLIRENGKLTATERKNIRKITVRARQIDKIKDEKRIAGESVASYRAGKDPDKTIPKKIAKKIQDKKIEHEFRK